MQNKKILIFDLDGTIIDSAFAIRSSLEIALQKNNIKNFRDLDSIEIGPPLRETVHSLVDDKTVDTILKVEADFKSIYDDRGFLNTVLYPGIFELLTYLKKNYVQLFLATNKRRLPTVKIIDHLNLTPFFSGIYCLDDLILRNPSKSDLLQFLLDRERLSPENCLYIGDTSGDMVAADKALIEFIYVNWGYGRLENCGSKKISHPNELFQAT